MNFFRSSRRMMLALLILAYSGTAYAGIEPYQNQLKGKIQKGDSLIVKDEKFRNKLFDWSDITNRTVRNFIVLQLVYDTPLVMRKAFTCEVELEVKYFSQPDQAEPISINSVKLWVNYSPDSGVGYKAKDIYDFSNGYWVKVTVKNITSKELGNEIPPVLQLSSQILVDRQYKFKPELNMQASAQISNEDKAPATQAERLSSGSLSSYHLLLTWPLVAGAEEYDIEWSPIESGTDKDPIIQQVLANAYVYPPDLDRIFRNNATRITTSANNFDISMVYSAKYLMVRMRQVSYQNGIRVEDNWDYKLENNTYAIWDISTYWHEQNLNWQYAANFSEEGTKKEVVLYFDGTLRKRQSVTLGNADNVVHIQEDIYDEFGRTAAKILPSIKNENNLRYYRDQNMNQSNMASYDYRNVRGAIGANCENLPEPLGLLSGAAKYFSSGNEFLNTKLYNRYIPNANGYPLTVTQYVNDNTGRARLVGATGSIFQPGASPGHVTKNYYGKPEPWELDRIFGNDVGFANRYQKNIKIDPTGQISITYLNGSGKTIATALSGAAPSNLDAIPGLVNKEFKTMPVLQPRQFAFDATALTLKATTTYLASVTGSASIAYDIQKLIYTYQGPAFQVCSNCYYDLKIVVKNDCNQEIYANTTPVQIGSQTPDCNNTGLQTGNLNVNFPSIGEYYITFEFALSKDVIERFTESYITTRQQNGNLLTELDFVLQYLQATDFFGCFSECRTCESALGTSASFMAAIKSKLNEYGVNYAGREGELDGWINGLYNTLRAHCLALKADCMLSPCARFEKLMLEDVSPGGQFALFDINPFVALEQDVNVLFKFWRTEFPILSSTDPAYINEMITLADGTETSPHDGSFTLEMLVMYWEEAWAQKFLKYHPEKCKLDFCNTYSSYIKWDDQVKEFISKASDIPNIPGSSGLSYQPNVPAWLLPADPFFKPGNPGNAYYNEMLLDLQQFSSRIMKITEPAANVKGLTHVVDYLLYCIDPDGSTNTGTGNIWNNCTPSALCRVPNKEWSSYKEYYFQLKEKYYIQARNAGECADACQVGTPYEFPGNCPTNRDFIVESVVVDPLVTPPCPGQKQLKLSHGRGPVRRSTTVTLYYPPEYSGLGLQTTFNFAVGESFKVFCVPSNVNVSSIKIDTVSCTGSASNPPCAFGTGGQLNLAPGAVQLASNRFQEVNGTTGMQVTYTIVQGQANQQPNGSTYCTTGTVSMQFYNCYKVFMPGAAMPFQYFNVWVISCSADQCANAPVYNMEMQMSTYKFYANGNYYYVLLNGGGGAYPECSYSTPAFQPCIKVYVTGNSTPFTFYNAGIVSCNTCSVGESVIIPSSQLSTNVFQMSDGGIYEIFPNTQPGYYPTSAYCATSNRDWFPCFKVTLYGVTTVYYNVTVLYCPPSTGSCDYAVHYYADIQHGIYHYSWGSYPYTEEYHIVPGDPCCPPNPYWYCSYGGQNYLDWAECVVFHVPGQPDQYYEKVWIVICTSKYCQYCKPPASLENALNANMSSKAANPAMELKKLQDEVQQAKAAGKNMKLVVDFTDNSIYMVQKATEAQVKEWRQKRDKTVRPAQNPKFTEFEFKRAFSVRTGNASYMHMRDVWVATFKPVAAKAGRVLPRFGTQKIDTAAGKTGALPPIECDTEFEVTYWSYGCDYSGQGGYFRVRPIGGASLCEGQTAYVDIVLYGYYGAYLYSSLYFSYGNDEQYICVDQYSLDNYGPTVGACGLINGSCEPEPVPCPPVLKDKKSRFPEVSFNFGVSNQEMQDMGNENTALLNAQIQTNCETQADQWMLDLAECLQPYSQATKDLLKAKLIEVCMKGGDIDHPFGASTTRPGETSASGYSSFKQAIISVLGLSQLTMTCNPWLMDEPHPYSPKQQSVEKIIATTNADLCAKLQQIRTAAGSTPLYTYLVNTYGNAMNLTQAQVNTLVKSCDNCRYILEEDIPLPVFLEPGATGCITKTEYDAAKAALAAEMGGSLSSSHANYEDVLSNYLNHRWGFSMAYHRYKAYEDELAINPAAILCNNPPFVRVDVDPYSCLKDLVASAVINGRREYEAYIIEEKRKFRVNYVNTCALAKANAKLTAEQQIYHYTLYYYDQAGNLIRTVSPEGVTFLTDAEMQKVTLAREFTAGDCTYNGPPANTDKNIALQQLSNAIGFNGDRAVEMWIYKNGSSASQTLAVTPDKQYMFQTCLSGNNLSVEIYSVTVIAPDNVQIVLSNHLTVNVASLQPLHSWMHVVVQGNLLASGALQVYVNGASMPMVAGNPPAACTWQIGPGNPVVLPENLGNLKHLRIYQRLLINAEILANAGEACLVINAGYQPVLNPQLLHWARFNTPNPGDPTTIASTSTVETQFVPVYPEHHLLSTYAFNSANQTVMQKTADGGTRKFWYDRLGRLVASQNEEQRLPYDGVNPNRYSYTKFDVQNRITEVGEKINGNLLPLAGFLDLSAISSFYASGTNSQITETIYDKVPAAGAGVQTGLPQDNLRKRVSASFYRETGGGTVLQATYYSYDLSGNSKTTWQQVEGLSLKRTDYEYDLASGKMNFIAYQHGANDQFYYNYKYDFENRITDAITGVQAIVDPLRGSYIPEPYRRVDAHYEYYLHGPLARIELGHDKVQGLDYAYTLQGWIKGINGFALDPATEIGLDGIAGGRPTVARDVFGYTIGYYQNDYQLIGVSGAAALSPTYQPQPSDITGKDLFNGNISNTTLALRSFGNGDPVGYTYRYDQLGRLKELRRHNLSATAGSWNSVSMVTAYKETMSYDANGNITALLRNGEGVSGRPLDMDNLAYGYKKLTHPLTGQVYLEHNRLRHIRDQVSDGNYSQAVNGTDDIDNQPADDNYSHDGTGNLVADAKEGITKIEWNIYGKIKKITKNSGVTINYSYDAAGRRVKQVVTQSGVSNTTWYVLDPGGNNLAIYEDKYQGNPGVWWKEQGLYGIKRLGIWRPNINISVATVTTEWNTIGNKSYEIGNHVNNTMVVISDKKIPIAGGYFDAEILAAYDYYSGGMLIPGRTFNLNAYRYGFNSKERDNDVYGSGNALNFGERIYDPRVSRWMSADPLAHVEPGWTPYRAFFCNPIRYTDPNGLLEFESYSAYKKHAETNKLTVLKRDEIGKQGHWLKSDRTGNTKVWDAANRHNLGQSKGNLQYRSITQRADFYEWFQGAANEKGHEIKWAGAAAKIANNIDMLTWGVVKLFGYSNDEIANFAEEGNAKIFNDVFDKLKTLYASDPKIGADALFWDNITLSQEQHLVQPLYKGLSNESFALLSALVKQRLAFSGWAPAPAFPSEKNLLNISHRWEYGMRAMGHNVDASKMMSPGSKYEYKEE